MTSQGHDHSDPFEMLRDHIDSQFESVNKRIDDKFDELKGDITELKHVLNGNGSPGIVKLVDRHEQQLKAGAAAERSSAAKWGGLSGIVTSVVVGVLTYFGVKPQ